MKILRQAQDDNFQELTQNIIYRIVLVLHYFIYLFS
jgi:hypothetical protein